MHVYIDRASVFDHGPPVVFSMHTAPEPELDAAEFTSRVLEATGCKTPQHGFASSISLITSSLSIGG